MQNKRDKQPNQSRLPKSAWIKKIVKKVLYVNLLFFLRLKLNN